MPLSCVCPSKAHATNMNKNVIKKTLKKQRKSGIVVNAPNTTQKQQKGVKMGMTLRSGIDEFVNSIQRDNPELSLSTRIKHAWNVTVDQRIAEHITAVFVVPNTNASEVIIYVDDPLWAAELNMQTEVLRSNINIELNKNKQAIPGIEKKFEQLEKLSFKLSKDEYISKEKKKSTFQLLQEEEQPYKQAQPIELNEEETTSLNISISNIENDVLRETIYAAAKANLEWQKGLKDKEIKRTA